MSKLITKPIECGYKHPLYTRLGLPFYIGCLKNKNIVCNNKEEFPKECPLVDGISTPITVEELVQIAKVKGLLFNVYAKYAGLQTITLIDKIVAHKFKEVNDKSALISKLAPELKKLKKLKNPENEKQN